MVHTKESLLKELHRFVEEYGIKPTTEEINMADGYPSANTFAYHFGTWRKALDAAGFDRTRSKHKLQGKRVLNITIMDSIRNGTAGIVRQSGPTNYAYELWRSMVLKRDGYKCTYCESEDDNIVHHILPLDSFPYSSVELDNGITLCRSCHTKVHKNNPELQDFCMAVLMDSRYRRRLIKENKTMNLVNPNQKL